VSKKAKVSGSVVAGFPSPAEQYLEPPLDLNELLVKRPAATYFVRVEGDSMAGAGINDGDLLVVDRSLSPANGDVIIASVDGDFTVKTYRRDKSGIRLEPANPAYPVIRLRAGHELDYFGKVTACIHRFAGRRFQQGDQAGA
jgi:DNA polymerase V